MAKKRETIKFNRKIQKAKEAAKQELLAAKQEVLDASQAGRLEAMQEVFQLLRIPQQALAYAEAGIDVTIQADLSLIKLLKIARKG